MRLVSVRTSLFALFSMAVLAACGDDEHDDHDHDTPDAAAQPDAEPDAPDTQAVTIQFAGEVNGAAFACGATFSGVGSTDAEYVASDFRFYVHDVALIPAGGGDPVPVALDAGDFQDADDGVALLDFETGGAGCQQGTTATHPALVGTVPAGSYDGISFKVGVPVDMNHLDPLTFTAPLDAPGMLWGWRGGFKFIKADGVVGGNGFNLHVGATGCPMGDPQTPPETPCTNANVMDVTFASFDPANDTIVADVGAVLDTVDVSVNTATTAPGCMSAPTDPECVAVFPRLGLAVGDTPAGTQVFLTVE